MSIHPYLNFNGNCREVVEYYADVFGLDKPHIMEFGDTPSDPSHPVPEEAKHLVMHARLNIEGTIVMFSDVFPGMPFQEGSNITLSIVGQDVDKLTSIFHKLKEGGQVGMELQETFWSKAYGNLTDKFGIQWQINHDNGDFSS
ncbi:VOC family protein [Paenibacillus alvei]|uniref:Glyoxalase n=1 Tax=Paenibacillus alvei TaxID=44250 RepID=A0A383RA76_PAEAL|nr:VOC family protein [Paenibacillus alvei]SYX83414.1 Glyoxalase [Paenibacillus alvei]